MATKDPSDQDARRRIHTELDSTLFVEAGAGTGKTRELIERIVRLVTSGTARLRNIAAITFTEAAAAELRDRVRLRLEQAEQDADGFSDEERQHCAEAISELDSASIETLHGFAQRILSEHPLEAGLPPLIEIQDEISASIAFEEHWSAFLDELLSDAALEDVLLRAFTLGLAPENLHKIAEHFHKNWDRLDSLSIEEAPPVSIDTSALAREILDIVDLRKECSTTDDKMVEQLDRIDPAAQRLAAAESELDQLRILMEMPKFSTRPGKQEHWQTVPIANVRDRLRDAQEQRDSTLATAGASTIPPLLSAIRRFVLDYAAERRTQGRLEFQDLLVLARELLRTNEDVRQAVRGQFTHLLIDEFQDTDPLQIEIAVLLASGKTVARWQDAEIDEGRLFFVGDPKQSIYRFRRADIELFQEAQERFASGIVHLEQNFRSTNPLIDWVNETFAQLMDSGNGDGQAAYLALQPSRLPDGAGPSLQLLGGPMKGNVARIRELEAKEIAMTVQAAKAEAWQITDGSDAGTRDARYADIAILIPTRTTLPQIEDALEEAGIPYRVEARSLVYDTQEIRDLLSILRAIDDPTDEVALIAALRSPAFACGDDDLLRFHSAGGRWDYRREPPESLADFDPVVAAMAALHDLHRRRWWEPINAIVEAVIRERRLFELAFTHHRPRERWQRLRFILDQSRAFAEAGGRTLRQFIDWAERQAEEGTRVVETVVPEPDDDAVRIMTIHAAKGLEFPIVFLAGLNVEQSSYQKANPVLWHKDGGLEAAIGGNYFRTPCYEERSQREEQLEQFEKVRLLYVGSTRARDHLIVSLHHKESSSGPKSLAAQLYLLCRNSDELWRDIKPVALPPDEPELTDFDDSPEQFKRWSEDRQQRIEDLRRVPMRSATEIVKEFTDVGDDPNVQKDPPVEEVPAWRRGRAGTAIGRAVHAVLQSIDLETRAGLENAARAQADAEGIAGRWQEIARMVEAALESPAVREAVAGGRYWRELFVSAPIGEGGVEGFVDLLYETDDGFVVVDYKTDRAPSDEDLEAALTRYTPQGATYALAIEEALGRRVGRCVFVFAAPGRAREKEVADLRAAIEQVRERISFGPRPNAPQAPEQSQLSLPGLPEE